MTASYLRRSRHQLWSDLLVALGGQEAFLTRHLTEKQMLLEILQIYGSPITTKRVNGFNALLEAVVNAAGGSASHLRQSKSEMLGALVTALGGTPPSVGYSSLTELLAACVNAADTGGGDLPAPPEGFSYLINADGAYILNANDAYILTDGAP